MSTYYVTTNAASGKGSLSYAVAHSVSGETIAFSPTAFTGPLTDTIYLAATLSITRSVTIDGLVNGNDIALDGSVIANSAGSANQTVLTVAANTTVVLDDLIIQNGTGVGLAGAAGSNGGAAAGGIINRGTLALARDTFTGNTATGGSGGSGVGTYYGTGGNGGYAAGAILNLGKLTVSDTGFNANTATGGSGGYAGLTPVGAGAGGGGGGNAAGAIYDAPHATIKSGGGLSFANNGGTGGYGGHAGPGVYNQYGGQNYSITGGTGGSGGVDAAGSPGGHGGNAPGTYDYAFDGAGGPPAMPGYGGAGLPGLNGYHGYGAGGGGGGGTGFINVNVAGIACFVRGTLIRTVNGPVAVEDLAPGDLAVTLGGTVQPVQWIGRRSYAGRFLRGQRHLLPVRIRAGAIGPLMPVRDLLVSPCHGMLMNGALVPAEQLVNGVTIVQERAAESVDYFHIELPVHSIIWAEDAPTESYLDVGNRSVFQAATGTPVTAPGVFCAPVITDGFELEIVRTRLSARAA